GIEIGARDCEKFDSDEKLLRQFDLDTTYGPCLGIARRERYERALFLGLDPSGQVKTLLEHSTSSKCLWEGGL
ncbi:hypothetical protein MARPO_0080s0095, partial [Marchantia polymorpha]